MSQRDSTSVDIRDLSMKTQFLFTTKIVGGKGLIGLEKLNIF